MTTTDITSTKLLKYLDYTLLDDSHSSSKLNTFLETAKSLNIASLCLYPQHLKDAHKACPNHCLTTVINFPSGAESLEEVKIEIQQSELADELDVVFPYKTYLNGHANTAFDTMSEVIQLLPKYKTIKVIIESGIYNRSQDISEICQFLMTQPIDFIKTSTGKTPIGATIDAAKVILATIKHSGKGIKISGGVRSLEQAHDYYKLAQTTFNENISPKNFRLGVSQIPS